MLTIISMVVYVNSVAHTYTCIHRTRDRLNSFGKMIMALRILTTVKFSDDIPFTIHCLCLCVSLARVSYILPQRKLLHTQTHALCPAIFQWHSLVLSIFRSPTPLALLSLVSVFFSRFAARTFNCTPYQI